MRYLVVVVTLLVSIAGWSQVLPFQFKGRVSNSDNGGFEGGVTIAVVQNGANVMSTQSASNGKYSLTGPVNYTMPFDVVFSKSGFVTKKVHIDLVKMNEEDVPPGEVRPFEQLDMTVFAERDNLDFSFLDNEPVGNVSWDTRSLGFDLDRGQAEMMKKKIDDLLNSAAEAEEELERNYQAAITAGDAAFANEEWEKALEKFEEALTYKPKEKYPSDKIVELDALIAAQKDKELADKQNQTEYDNLIAAADNLRDQDKLKEAVGRYKEASQKKPTEQYPKDQISALEAKIAQLEKEKEAQAAYDAAIEKADMFFKQNSLKAARDKYQEASALKPSEQYPKDKLNEIDGKMKEVEAAAEKKQKYDAAIAAADAAFDKEDYQTAKAKYEEALTFESSSSYAKGRLAICDEKLKDILAELEKQKQIEQLLKDGQTALDAKEFDNAIGKYDEVLALEAENATAKEKKALAEKLKAESEKAAAADKQFNDLVAQGDNAVGAKNYSEAISKYEEALTLKTDAGVQTKLDDAKAKLKAEEDLAAKQEAFQKLIDEGNTLMGEEKLQEAKAKFVEAQKLDASSDIPPAKIKEIDALLGDKQAAAEKLQKYNDAIAEADKLFGKEKWTEAKAKYEEALTFAEDPAYANGKIEEINQKIASSKELAERQAKYDAAIAVADKAFDAKSWDEAKSKYEEAKTFTDDPSYPTERIAKIDEFLADEQKAKDQEAKIAGLLAEGESLYSNSKLEDAKAKYEEVLALDSKNQTAKDQIAKINGDLAAQKNEAEREAEFKKLKEEGFALAGDEKYDQAKSKLEAALAMKDDAEVKSKIDEINSIQAKNGEISSLILDGEALLSKEKYEEAKAKFEAVLAKDATNQDAKTGIEKAQAGIDNKAKLASESEKFNQLKTDGLKLKNQEKYSEAKSKLNEALGIQEDTEIREALEAIRIAEEKSMANAEKEEQYQNLISEGDNLVAAGSFNDAIAKYKEAKSVMPSKSEPDEKIAAAEKGLKDLAKQEEINKEYREHLDKGDELVKEEKYLEAIEEFNKALALKPTEQEPVDKAANAEELAINSRAVTDKMFEKNLAFAETKIEEGDYNRATEILNSTESLVKSEPERLKEIQKLRDKLTAYKKRDADYDKRMADAQKAYDSKKYDKALDEYREASKLKENEQLPKEKIEELENLIASEQSKEQREKLYNEYMEKGAKHVDEKKYELALSDYENALQAKKDDPEAKAKMNEVQQILDDLANKSDKERELKNKFNAIVGEANLKFNAEEFLAAKAKYEEALALIPTDEYVKNRIDECVKREQELSNQAEQKQYEKLIEAADKNFKDEDYDKAKERYNTAVSFRPADPYPKKKLAEIEAILNPATVQSGQLEDPGVRLNNTSILDGQALLQQAQNERDAYEKQKLQTKMDKADSEIAERSAQKTKDREEARQDIVDVYQNVSEYNETADMKHNENAEILKKAKTALEDENRDESQLDYNVNVGDQEQLDKITESVALNYGERSDVYMDNAETMESYEVALDRAMSAQANSDYGSSIASDQKLIEKKAKVNSEVQDDFEERDEVRQQVSDVEQSVAKANAQLSYADYEVNHVAKEEIEGVYRGVETKTAEDTKIARDNNESLVVINDKINSTSNDLGTSESVDNYKAEAAINKIVIDYDNKATEDAEAIAQNGEELKAISNEINQKEISMTRQETEFAYDANRQMEGYKEKMASDFSGMDDNRKESVEILKKGNKELADAQVGMHEKNQNKALDNKGAIEKETETNNKISLKAEESHAINVAGVEALDNKARQSYAEEQLSDEQERLNSQGGISDVYKQNSENTNSSTEKQKKNSEVIDNSKRLIDVESGDRSDENQNKVYGAAEKISKIDNKPEEKAVIANSLGEEYPEGVTEESFAQNDQNGLMKAIVTRRIVVIDGHADVYQRTQTLGNVTYSRNGKPITEHDWNSQTQGPHLVRHTK